MLCSSPTPSSEPPRFSAKFGTEWQPHVAAATSLYCGSTKGTTAERVRLTGIARKDADNGAAML